MQEDLINKDTFFMDDMLYTPLTNQEIKKDTQENTAIEASLKPIHIDLKIKKSGKSGKSKKNGKSKKSRKSYANSHRKSRKLKFKKNNVKELLHGGGNKDPVISSAAEEIEKYSEFLDKISLKTESGVLPLFRRFEDKDENILACLFYGFYMRLAINTNKNNYLIKLSKIIAKNKRNVFVFLKELPELVIYQNLSIDGDSGMTTLGIVSKLTPRIINSFI
jgi:hypothetical protein